MNNPSAGASSKTGLGTRPSTGVSHTKSASIAGTVTKNPTEQNGTGVKKVTKDMPSSVLTTTNKLTESNVSNMRDRFISLELNNLKSYGYFYGIYCVPRHFKPHIWDGVIIIRSGLYKNGKFKFYMEFPRGFPKNKPEIYFVTKVYHPLIDTETGHLDLNLLSPDWKGNSTISYNLFAWLKSIFHDTTYLQVTDSYNPKAGAEFLENIEAFYEKVCECIDHSEKELFDHEEQDGLKFNPYNAVHEVIQKKLGEVVSNKDIPDSRRVDYFIDALLKTAKSDQ